MKKVFILLFLISSLFAAYDDQGTINRLLGVEKTEELRQKVNDALEYSYGKRQGNIYISSKVGKVALTHESYINTLLLTIDVENLPSLYKKPYIRFDELNIEASAESVENFDKATYSFYTITSIHLLFKHESEDILIKYHDRNYRPINVYYDQNSYHKAIEKLRLINKKQEEDDAKPMNRLKNYFGI